MTCPACILAETDPRRDGWTAGCLSCAARALACIGTLAEDTDALRRMFGAQLAEGSALFNRWAGVLRRHQAGQAARP